MWLSTLTTSLLLVSVLSVVTGQTTVTQEDVEETWGTVPPTETSRDIADDDNNGLQLEGIHEACLLALDQDLEEHDFAKACPEEQLQEQVKRRRERRLRSRGGDNDFDANTFISISKTNTTLDDGIDTDLEDVLRGLARSKRLVTTSESKRWTRGVVPYVIQAGDKKAIKRAMSIFERSTCIRFVEWEDGLGENGDLTTNDVMGLGHKGYLKFITGNGCYSGLGNSGKPAQAVSCCGGDTCIHEIGHAMGAYHEHQNPGGQGIVQVNPGNAQNSYRSQFKVMEDIDSLVGFDFNSVMIYGKTSFSNGKGETVSWLFSDLPGGTDWFYLMEEISLAHKCHEEFCSDLDLECVNDGYLTLVDGVCGCKCPPGLDPGSGCADVLGSDQSWHESIRWPSGQYALPAPVDGCPDDVFSHGSRTHTGSAPDQCKDLSKGCPYWEKTKGCWSNPGFMYPKCPVTCGICETYGNHGAASSSKTGGYQLAGVVNHDQVEHQFCVKDAVEPDNDVTWPVGQYCVYRAGGQCPSGFEQGSVSFSDGSHSQVSNSVDGALPDGEFGDSRTKFEFCCTFSGDTKDVLTIPPIKPFALLKAKEVRCHEVEGMHAYGGNTVVKQPGEPDITGATPVFTFDSKKKEYSIPYCYYVPANTDCGQVIELTHENPTASFSGSSGQDFQCNWLIKGPQGSRILLNFDSFNVASKSNGDCIDEVSVRFNRLSQKGKTICGKQYPKSTSSVYNTMMVTYDTFDLGESSFTATVTLLHPADSCYNTRDHGNSYDGHVSVTRGFKDCVPWSEVGHCDHNPFMAEYLDEDLVENYCRNPHSKDGLRPWCYYDGENCKRDYCDVCAYENVYDSFSKCDVLEKLGMCEHDPVRARSMCAKTCGYFLSRKKREATTPQGCSPPGPVSDGDVVGDTKSSYSVGEVVTYTCSNISHPTTRERRCLTSGQWSALNYVCTECQQGWTVRDRHCYMFVDDSATYDQAVENCEALGATLAMAKTEEMAEFLNSFDDFSGVWVAGSDVQDEGVFKWIDGSDFTWSRWENNEPDNWHNEDCVYMDVGGYFTDKWCTRDRYHYVCVKPAYDVTTCDDVSNMCENLYSHIPEVCDPDNSKYSFMAAHCKATCGLCTPATCQVEDVANAHTTEASGQLQQGGYIKYECNAGFVNESGTGVRGCLATGKLTGEPLVCKPNSVLSTELVGELKKESKWGSKYQSGYTYTGDMPQFRIPQDGKVVRWEFYSDRGGEGAFQVWRPTGKANNYEFVGQNQVATPDDMEAALYVPEDQQIIVKEGDLIGVHYAKNNRFGVGYTKCAKTSDYPKYKNLRKSKTKWSDPGQIEVGKSYQFKSESKDKCRYYKIRAVVSP